MIDTKELVERHQARSKTTSPVWHSSEAPNFPPTESGAPPPQHERTNPAETLKAKYIDRVMRGATVIRLEDDSWFADNPRVPDVWGRGVSEEASIEHLESMLREWVDWKIEDHDDDIPVIDGIDLRSLS